MAEVTQLLLEWRAGDQKALDRLMPVIYRDLHQMARRFMAGENAAHTLQASALVNQAYLKHVTCVEWQNRVVVEMRFFGGLSTEETAEALKISTDTVLRDWKFAKAWLQRELHRGDS